MITLAFPPIAPTTDLHRISPCIFETCSPLKAAGIEGGCADVHEKVLSRLEASAGTLGEDTAAALHHARGWSHFSVRDLLFSSLRDGVPAALNMSTCGFVSQLLQDTIHPRRPSGHLLIADWLVDHFERAMAALDADPGGVSARVSALGRRRPPRPVNANLAEDLPHKCYVDWLIPLQPVDPLEKVLSAREMEEASWAVEAGGPVPEVKETGEWHFVTVEFADEGDREIRKRGWLVSRVGARATVHINTEFHGEGIDTQVPVGVTIGRAGNNGGRRWCQCRSSLCAPLIGCCCAVPPSRFAGTSNHTSTWGCSA